ncbi:MAG: GNAT family N-acetyltransferase [Desulfobacteraceae bacterium 4572_87]|nr:MAG: GNAT family N-acetyltransferase [Desulfobacteraceae bacterium 4572_87]
MDDMVNNLLIRKIKPEDAPEITAIQAAITNPSTVIDFKHIIEEKVQNNEEVSFSAELDGKIVGYMISYVVFGGFGLEKSAWIATLGVDPKYMGQSIGRLLAEKLLAVYREKGIDYIFTTVRWDSVDLLSFFKTLGFDRSDYIHLTKKLDAS